MFDHSQVQFLDLSQPAAQLNECIENTSAQYMAFFRESDRAAREYFGSILEQVELHKKEGGEESVCCFRGAVAGDNGKTLSLYKPYPKEQGIISAEDDFRFAAVYVDGMVCEADAVRSAGVRFSEELIYGRDELFALQLTEQISRSLYIPQVVYIANRVFDEMSDSAPQTRDLRWYTDLTGGFADALLPSGNCSRMAQFGFLYLMSKRFAANQNAKVKGVFPSPSDCDAYLARVASLLGKVENTVFFSPCPAYGLSRRKLLYLADLGIDNPHRIKKEYVLDQSAEDAALVYACDPDRVPIERLRDAKALIQGMEFVGNGDRKGLRFDLRVETCFPHEMVAVVLQKKLSDGQCVEYEARWTPRLAGYVTFFDKEAFVHASYEAFVPATKGEGPFRLRAMMRAGAVECYCAFRSTDSYQSRIAPGVKGAYWSVPGAIVRCRKNVLSYRPAGRLRKMGLEVKYLMSLGELGVEGRESRRLRMAFWATRPFFARKRIWAYYDKAYKAGDNAEYAFRYACQQRDGIEKVFYINNDCDDSRRLRETGYAVLTPGTLRSSLYALNSEVIHMTHIPAYKKMGLDGKRLQYVKDLLDPAVIRLYHGFPITRSSSYAQIHSDAAGVVVGSNYEVDLYGALENGFSDEQIIRSGMPRYDDLVDAGEKRILLAPSWRPSLPGKSLPGGERLYNPNFTSSYYYKVYAAVLSDKKLVETARQYGYRLTMFLHPTLSAQAVDFESTDVVESLSCTKDVDYVTIMRKSSLMVTDFSSVQYDFAYMRKPVVYFHDPALPYWRITNFDYEGIGFGEICQTVKQLVDTLCSYIESDCELREPYRKRVEEFFLYDDRDASRRVYESVRQISDKKKYNQKALR
ncbi:CDP-glycerol glycerophosphotransferase family protein [Adlercreutzia caecimuris]|uniref:CDP-glycerol glycerophosphotransferase family protein n=1 Tax=Adlercreutzia caecimuris TaxID=671266 RepID=UPI001372A398|nr:CDP-glycerol glycerophosphotransferase family protein [Adlercreutzia caecimuris]NBJ66235.1 hypothetical protein [Adlercreutzia caecimuris]